MHIPAVAQPTQDRPTIPIGHVRQPMRIMPLIPKLPGDIITIGPATGAPSTDNPWKLPIRTGKIELSALFTRKRGEITQSDKVGFVMKVDDQEMRVMADPDHGDGHVNATMNGQTQHGVITNNSNRSTLRLDDGSTITVTDKGRERFSVTGIAPVTVDVRYIDGLKRKPKPAPAYHQDPWYRCQDSKTMTFGQKVRSYIKSLFEVSCP